LALAALPAGLRFSVYALPLAARIFCPTSRAFIGKGDIPMHGLNLLPPRALRKQQNRRLALFLAAVQTLLVLTVLSLGVLLAAITERAERQSHALALRLEDEHYRESDRIAEQLRNKGNYLDSQALLFLSATPSRFDYAWLDVANRCLPPETALLSIEVQPPVMTVAAVAGNWQQTEVYRASLLETGIFEWVRFGSLNRLEDGRIRFDLQMGLSP
jgi:Tfp pilus assembly protein PilN